MELRKIREAEWREYVKQPQLDVEYFDIEKRRRFRAAYGQGPG
jgi:hypothetical protein